MKIKSFMTMMMAAMAFMFGMSSCSSSNDDAPEAPVANQVIGSYTGNEVLTVMGEDDESTETFEFTKATDVSVDVTLPKYGEGMMTVPALPVKGIMLTKSGNTITGKLAKYEGVVTNADGSEKAYTISDVTVIFNEKTVVMTFTQKYGNMPFAFEGQFTGTRK
jgi:hypothetical protein